MHRLTIIGLLCVIVSAMTSNLPVSADDHSKASVSVVASGDASIQNGDTQAAEQLSPLPQ